MCAVSVRTASRMYVSVVSYLRRRKAWNFFLGFLCNCLSYFTTARITFTCNNYIIIIVPKPTVYDIYSRNKLQCRPVQNENKRQMYGVVNCKDNFHTCTYVSYFQVKLKWLSLGLHVWCWLYLAVLPITHFWVGFQLCFKARPSTKPFTWKLIPFTCKATKFACK